MFSVCDIYSNVKWGFTFHTVEYFGQEKWNYVSVAVEELKK